MIASMSRSIQQLSALAPPAESRPPSSAASTSPSRGNPALGDQHAAELGRDQQGENAGLGQRDVFGCEIAIARSPGLDRDRLGRSRSRWRSPSRLLA